MYKYSTKIGLSIFIILGALASPCFAQGDISTSGRVVVNVAPECSFSTQGVNFGVLGWTSNVVAQTNATGILNASCTNGYVFSISIGAGANNASSQKRMKHSIQSVYINYGIFTDSGYSSSTSSTTGTGTPNPITLYAQIPASQTVTQAGVYTDSVTISLTF